MIRTRQLPVILEALVDEHHSALFELDGRARPELFYL
jgi:hypothetical protein